MKKKATRAAARPKAARAQGRKKAGPKSSRVTKKAGSTTRSAASEKKTKRRVTKAEHRATHKIRRKPTAPDMTLYVRDGLKLTDEQIVEAKGTIVRALVMRGNVREATSAAGIHRTTAYTWREKDRGFADAWDAAVDEATDRMEEEAWRRGIEGFDRPVIFQGKITDTYKDYSDSLLLTLMRGHRPERFKDRREHSTPAGRPMEMEVETKTGVMSSILGMVKAKE